MIKIAVCDDEIEDLEYITSLVRNYLNNNEIQLMEFTRAADILEHEDSPFDIVLMDIEMPPPNGFEVARSLKKWNRAPIVILITNSRTHTLKGYHVAMRYLQKPIEKEQLYEALGSALQVLKRNKAVFIMGNSALQIDIRDIIYIEMSRHYAVIHTGNEVYKLRDKLENIINKLPYSNFCSPHCSYLINMDYIKEMGSRDMYLINGVRIPISKSRHKEFTTRFFSYCGETK